MVVCIVITTSHYRKRKLFNELMEGVDARQQQREGKITLRSHEVEDLPPLEVDADLIRDTREIKLFGKPGCLMVLEPVSIYRPLRIRGPHVKPARNYLRYFLEILPCVFNMVGGFQLSSQCRHVIPEI